MHYSQYYPVDVINGPGTRVTLFVSGCEHQCKGCYNQSTWSPRNGSVFTQAMEDKIINDLNDPRIRRKGLSLSGGDPLYPSNLENILMLVKELKRMCWKEYMAMDWLYYRATNTSSKKGTAIR